MSVASAWIDAREFARLMQLPWAVAAITDTRLSAEERLRPAIRIMHAPPEERDEFFSERLRQRLCALGLDEHALSTGFFDRALCIWSWLVMAVVGHIEFWHGRNLRRSHGTESWVNCVAKVLLEESMRELEQLRQTKTMVKRQCGNDEKKHKAMLRQPSVRYLFNQEFGKVWRSLGHGVGVQSASYWEANRAAFEALCEAELEEYKERRAERVSAMGVCRAAQAALPTTDAPELALAALSESGSGAGPLALLSPGASSVDLGGLPSSALETSHFDPETGEIKKAPVAALGQYPLDAERLAGLLRDEDGAASHNEEHRRGL